MTATRQLVEDIRELVRRVDATAKALPASTPGLVALRCTEELLERAAAAAEVAAGRVPATS